MKKNWMMIGVLCLPLWGNADQIATSAAMSTLQSQLDGLNQQISSAQQTLNSVNQSLQNMQKQSSLLRQQIAQYANTNAKQFKWVDVSEGTVPSQVFVAARNQGQPVYVCQATYAASGYGGATTYVIPGVVTAKGCVVTYGGQAYLEPDYAILTSTVPGYWINGDQVKNTSPSQPVCPMVSFADAGASNALVVPNPRGPSNQPKPLYNALAIIGGADNNGNTYICRVDINGQYFVGKATGNTCFVAAGAYEANWPIYQVLLTRQP